MPDERDGSAREVGAGMARLFSVAFSPKASEIGAGDRRETADPFLLPIRSSFQCPITQDIMQNPVLTADGCCYDREAILEWFERGNTTSPSTNLRLPSTDIIPCGPLGTTIQEYLRCRPEVRPRESSEIEREFEARRLQSGRDEAQMELAALRATVRSLAEELGQVEADRPHGDVRNAMGRVQHFLAAVSEDPPSQVDDGSNDVRHSEATLSVGREDGTLALSDTHSRRQDLQLDIGGSILASAWHQRSMLCTGSDDGVLRFIDVGKGRVLSEVAHPNAVLAVAWNSSGLSVATGCADCKVRVISAVSGRVQREIHHSAEVRAVTWDPVDSSTLATGCNDGALRFIEGATGAVKREVWHRGWVLCVAWSPSGGYMVTGCGDGKLRIVDTALGNVRPEVQLPGSVPTVAWCPTAHSVASGCIDGVVRIIDAATGCIDKQVPLCAVVRTVSWHPDGRQLAMGCGDGTLRVMDVAIDRVELSEDRASQVMALTWIVKRISPVSAPCGDEASCSRLVFAPTRRRKRQRSTEALLPGGCLKRA